MSTIAYIRTQPGTAMLVALLFLLGVQALFTFGRPIGLPFVVITTLLLCIGVIFSTMTIAVSDDAVAWWFTFGILRQEIPMSEILFVVSDKVTLLNGLGIRTNGRDWLWIVSGSNVVSLELRSGRKVSLGSPDAQKLALLIEGIVSSR